MHFGRFVLYTALGSLPWSLALVYAGKSLGDNWEQVRTVLGKFDYAIVAIVIVAVGWYVYHHLSHALKPAASEGGRPEPTPRR
jgi:membrane protein DedA with SNARE-associated domain